MINVEKELAKQINEYLKSIDRADYTPEWGPVLYELNRLRAAEAQAKQQGNLDDAMKSELYSIMITKHLQLRPWYANSGRAKACARLVKIGFFIPVKEKNNPDFIPEKFYPNDNISYTITEKGLDWILALNPDDFQHQFMFPKPHDVLKWHERIKSRRA
jgi:hypothetical protein